MTPPTALEAIGVGRIGSYPAAPDPVQHAELVLACRDGARRSADLEPILEAGDLFRADTTELLSAFHLGAALLSSRSNLVELVSRTPDATDVRLPLREVPPGRPLEQNDGYLVHQASSFLPAINLLAGRIATARGARVVSMLLFGSLPFPLAQPTVGETWTVTLNGAAVVRPGAGPPAEIDPGNVLRCSGWPRIHTDPAVCSVLIGIETLVGPPLRMAFIERAAHHPLLRLDSAIDIDTPVTVYGLDQPTDYSGMIRDAARQIHHDAPFRDLDRWAVLGNPQPALAVPGTELTTIRGRFAGGIGVVGRAEDGRLLLRAGGSTLGLDDQLLPWLCEVISGAPVDVGSDPVLRASAQTLVRLGLAEPLIGPPRSVVPAAPAVAPKNRNDATESAGADE
jgi:hypothetical protein